MTSTLTINDLASNDFDDYNCTIKNERGMDSMVFTLSQTGEKTIHHAMGYSLYMMPKMYSYVLDMSWGYRRYVNLLYIEHNHK